MAQLNTAKFYQMILEYHSESYVIFLCVCGYVSMIGVLNC